MNYYFEYFSDASATIPSTDWDFVDETYFELPNETATQIHVCKKCIDLDIELQKAKSAIRKLQNRCAEKTAHINRLNAAEKRHKILKSSMEDILRQLKEKKWISEEGQNVLRVIKS